MSDFAQELTLQIPRLRRYARALTYNVAWADDLVQDTLERALRRRWLFRINSNLTAWLMTMLYRLYLNDCARKHFSPAGSGSEQAELEQIEASEADDPALRMDVQNALASLSVEHRAVIVLIGLEQLSYKEASEVLGVPLGTVMSRLARARDRLRSLLSGTPLTAGHSVIAPHLTRIK